MTENIRQTIRFNALQAMSRDLTPEQKKIVNEITTKGDEDGPENRENALLALLDEKQKEELKTLGVESPLDKVDVHLRLGNLLFDMYQHNVKFPSAPMAKRVEENRRNQFVEILNADEFEVPEEVVNAARDVMSDDSKWAGVRVHAWIDTDEKDTKIFLPMSGKGLGFYKDIINAALDLIDD